MVTMLATKPCSLLTGASVRRCPAAFLSVTARASRPLLAQRSSLKWCPAPRSVIAHASSNEGEDVKLNKEFGYSRKDVILIGVGLIALGYALYYGLQATGMEAGYAGNWVQLIIFMGICVGWVSTYIFRVATKQMTYVKQLEQYEEAVMKKRVEEMTEAELEQLAGEVEADRQGRLAARQPPKQG